MTDFVTLLHAVPPATFAKRIDAAGKVHDYHAGQDVTTERVEVASLEDMCTLLRMLSTEPRTCVIRGRAKDDVAPGDVVWRRSRDSAECPAAFEPHAHRWLMVDNDETAVPFDRDDPIGSINAWRALLPTAPINLRDASMVWVWSSKAHLAPNVRGHAWFWLAEPAEDVPLRTWAVAHGFDPAVYRAVQPHCTAAPVFEVGADPIAERVIWCE